MTGAGTALDPYVIWDVNDLQDMANGAPYAAGAYYELGCDIDATPTAGWNWDAIRGVFEGFLPRSLSGQLDGNRHNIDGLYINRESAGGQYLGLISSITVFGVNRVQNVRLTNINYYGRGNGEQSFVQIGGVVGYIDRGTIYRCYVRSGSIVARNDRWGFPGTTAANAGGILGGFGDGGRMEQCYSNVSVEATHSATSHSQAGGLVAIIWQRGDILNCFARGPVMSWSRTGGAVGLIWDVQGTVTNVYSTGTVLGGIAGGLIGARELGGVAPVNSFWDMESSGIAISDGGTGLTTLQAKTQATYTAAGWNFVTVWTLDWEYVYWNDGYPFFLDDPMPTITVISPNGGEVWLVDSTYNILWTHTGDAGTHVQIDLFLAGILDELIVASTIIGAAVGNYSWHIDPGKMPSQQYRVRITSTSLPHYSDMSDNDFTIAGKPSSIPVVATLPATGVG